MENIFSNLLTATPLLNYPFLSMYKENIQELVSKTGIYHQTTT